jgi:hypothetical protein
MYTQRTSFTLDQFILLLFLFFFFFFFFLFIKTFTKKVDFCEATTHAQNTPLTATNKSIYTQVILPFLRISHHQRSPPYENAFVRRRPAFSPPPSPRLPAGAREPRARAAWGNGKIA